jgi:transglutaminase-like putative cysteine protease
MNYLPAVFKRRSAVAPKVAINHLHILPQHHWYLCLCQCLNIVLIAQQLQPWMLAIIALALIWQVLFIHQRRQYTRFIKNSKNRISNKQQERVKANLQANKQTTSVGHKKQLISSDNVPYTKSNTSPSLHVPPFILAIFAIFGCIAIALNAKQLGVLASMVHLLCFAYALKPLELKTRGDFYQLVLLGVFVIASSLIFKQNLAFSVVVLILLLLNLMALLQYFSCEKKIVNTLKVMSLLIIQSTVLAVVLFLVFPRLSPFWQVPRANSAETGLSDTIKPGDIAKLTRSTKLAFRADFEQQTIPVYSSLYWRAMVLEHYDGSAWSSKPDDDSSEVNKQAKLVDFSFDASQTNVPPVNYRMVVEPSYQKYLFALTPAIVSPQQSNIKVSKGYTFQNNNVITQAQSYQLTSFLTAPIGLNLSKQQQRLNILYPKGSNPKLEALGAKLKQQHVSKMQRAQAVLDMINQETFSYTLQPPLLTNNSLDQFFFDTRAGFCAHYASAFTLLMRASGIPSRMVTGYLGGEYNDSNDQQSSLKKGHLSVYQYDAHAWSEIWIQDQGWIRIDPTAAVDPQRVNSGWSDQLLQEQAAFNNNIFNLYRMKNIAWLRMLRLQFDALDYQWTRWVIGFTTKQQLTLFKAWFGNMAHWKLIVIIGVALILSMLGLLLFLHYTNNVSLPKKIKPLWHILYNKVLQQLKQQGIEKPISMTAEQFSAQIRQDYPTLGLIFSRFTACYCRLCYKKLTDTERQRLSSLMQKQYKVLRKSIAAKQ